jgi:hypothetical protein
MSLGGPLLTSRRVDIHFRFHQERKLAAAGQCVPKSLYGVPSTTAHHRGAAAAGVQIRAAAAERVAANEKMSGPLFHNYPLSGHGRTDAFDPRTT